MKSTLKKCPTCRGKFKLIKKSYVFKTRDERRRIMNIENLPYLECTICDYEEITEQGEDLIKEVKNMVKIGMETLVRKEELELHSSHDNKLSSVFRRFIG